MNNRNFALKTELIRMKNGNRTRSYNRIPKLPLT